MKTLNLNSIKLLFLAVIFVIPLTGFSQTTYHIKSHEVTIEGTSNLQSWTADVEKTTGTIKVVTEGGKIVGIQEAKIQMDATTIKGSEGRRMDSKIYDALDTSKHPSISFTLRDINSLTENPGTARVNASGVLTVAGVSKTITLNTVGKLLPNGDIEFSGNQKIVMSDHGVSPPTALLGALKTGDEVNIVYKIVLNAR